MGATRAIDISVDGDGVPRLSAHAEGSLHFSDGEAPPDLHVERANTGDLFLNAGYVTSAAGFFGADATTAPINDDAPYSGIGNDGTFFSRTDGTDKGPPVPGSGTGTACGLIYARTSGGKNQLVARFPTGAVQVLATEP